jgi:alkyl hydroperoxide reductase subunit AhpC
VVSAAHRFATVGGALCNGRHPDRAGAAKIIRRADPNFARPADAGRAARAYRGSSQQPLERIAMNVHVGSPAPAVVAEAYRRGDDDPVEIDFDNHRGSWIVLFFYPRDFTFVCPTELRAFAELEPDFAAEDAMVVAASTDSYWSHRAWFEAHALLAGVDYPVIADTAHDLASAFGVLAPDGSALRATFVIDPDGVLRHASVTDQSVGRSPDETLRVLQALRTGALCPVDWRPGEPTLKAA